MDAWISCAKRQINIYIVRFTKKITMCVDKPNPTQSNPWMDPTHVHVWIEYGFLLVFYSNFVPKTHRF